MFRLCNSNLSLIWRRSIGLSAVRRYKDPIHEIFLEKVNEYREKSPTGKPLDAGPEFEKELNETLEKLAVKFGGGEGVDMLEFPKFKEPEVTLDPLSILVKPEEKTLKKEDSMKKPKEMKAAATENEKAKKTKDQEKTKEAKATAKDTKATAKDTKATAKDTKATAKDTKAKAKDTKATAKDTKAKAKDTKAKAEDTKPKDDKKKK